MRKLSHGEPHLFKSLDWNEADNVRVPINMRDLVEMVNGLQYGTHRFLSHLIDVRREALAEKIARYRARGDHDVAASAEASGDPLIGILEAALKDGLY